MTRRMKWLVWICVNPLTDADKTVLVVSEKGFGKRTKMDEYRYTNRGGKGVKTINVTEKTGALVGLLDVAQKQDLMITCKSGVTIRMKVSRHQRAGQGHAGGETDPAGWGRWDCCNQQNRWPGTSRKWRKRKQSCKWIGRRNRNRWKSILGDVD